MKTSTLTDTVEGQSYKTVKIGKQIWMAENLRSSRYRDGKKIHHIEDDELWGKNKKGAWCFYNNDHEYGKVYGKLYNWAAVNSEHGLAPEGWHIPTDKEWMQLEIFLGMNMNRAEVTGWRGKIAGGKLKESGELHWTKPNEGASNESGFAALPGGYRDVEGSFYVVGAAGYWWSKTEHHEFFPWYRSIFHTSSRVHRTFGYGGDGFSVRCIMD